MISIDNDTNKISIIKKDTAALSVALDNYFLTDGDKVTFTVANAVEQEEPLLQIVVTEFTDEGGAVISLSSQDTDLEIGEYLYDIQVDTQDGRVDTIVGPAKIKIMGGVTY